MAQFVGLTPHTAAEVGARRQVFFVSMGGFDLHDALADQVTTFTASDFGRTITGTNGSDHGWVSMHVMLDGAVKGGRFYASAPEIANNGPDDAGRGRLIPTTSVDLYFSFDLRHEPGGVGTGRSWAMMLAGAAALATWAPRRRIPPQA